MKEIIIGSGLLCGAVLLIWAIIEEVALYKANKELDKYESERKKFVLGVKTNER